MADNVGKAMYVFIRVFSRCILISRFLLPLPLASPYIFYLPPPHPLPTVYIFRKATDMRGFIFFATLARGGCE
jgi:hypothetical protein